MLLKDRGRRRERGEGTAQLVADVTRKARVALESLDELTHHLVERFGELLDLAVRPGDLEPRREVSLGDGARGERDALEGAHGSPRHPEAAADADERRREGAKSATSMSVSSECSSESIGKTSKNWVSTDGIGIPTT